MRSVLLAALLGTAIVCSSTAQAQLEYIFVYQGNIMEDGEPANGEYEFQLRLVDDLNTQIGSTQFASAIATDGIFQVDMDFGPGAFDGSIRYLEISVRPFLDPNPYTLLSPSQLITSTPVAQFALSGNEGPQGDPGEQGEQGPQGSVGPQGVPGADGNDGAQGIQGEPGNDGAEGLQGIQGDQGTPGDSHWELNGSRTYYNGGNVGIGTGTPGARLDVITDNSISVRALNAAPGGITFYGISQATEGIGVGGLFGSSSSSGTGVSGRAYSSTGTTTAVSGIADSTQGTGVSGFAVSNTGVNYGVRGRTLSTVGYAGYFEGGKNYFEGNVGIGENDPQFALDIVTDTTRGASVFTTGEIGTIAYSSHQSGTGLFGYALNLTGVNYGVRGLTQSPNGYAGYFEGGKNYFQGRTGIGTSSPSDQLHINAPAGEFAMRVQTNGSTRFRINANGGISLGANSTIIGAGDVYIANKLGIGTNAPTFDLSVSGTAAKTGGGSWAVFSDERLKKNITPMTGSLDTISALRPVNFEYTAKDHFSFTPGVQSGFIAQQVQAVIPQWVNTAEDGYLYLDQVGYEALIVDAIQELREEKDAENAQLRTELLRRDTELKQLRSRLDRLERALLSSSNTD